MGAKCQIVGVMIFFTSFKMSNTRAYAKTQQGATEATETCHLSTMSNLPHWSTAGCPHHRYPKGRRSDSIDWPRFRCFRISRLPQYRSAARHPAFRFHQIRRNCDACCECGHDAPFRRIARSCVHKYHTKTAFHQCAFSGVSSSGRYD